jgi:hypothetical protein
MQRRGGGGVTDENAPSSLTKAVHDEVLDLPLGQCHALIVPS